MSVRQPSTWVTQPAQILATLRGNTVVQPPTVRRRDLDEADIAPIESQRPFLCRAVCTGQKIGTPEWHCRRSLLFLQDVHRSEHRAC